VAELNPWSTEMTFVESNANRRNPGDCTGHSCVEIELTGSLRDQVLALIREEIAKAQGVSPIALAEKKTT
jgi:hypothetical protein